MSSQDSIHKGVIAWFIHNPVAANLLMLVILFAGIGTALGLKVEGFPSTPPMSITIDVAYESGDASQAEQSIAVKIEQALSGTPGIQDISSTSSSRGVSIQVESISDYDLDKLTVDVKNIVDGINSLPTMAEKPVISQRKREQTALWVSVYGDASQIQLQHVARQLEEALLALPSINKVIKDGWRSREIAIEVDENILQSYHLTLADIAERIRQESLTATSGELRSQDGVILLKADKQRFYQQEFENIVIANFANGSRITLGEIARVSDGFAETPNVLSRYKAKRAINLDVRVDREADILAIAEDARQLVKRWQTDGKLPNNIAIELWMDQSINMLDRLDLIIDNGLIGIILVMMILTVFLNFRVAFWVGMGLPVCFAGGFIFMGPDFYDLTINQLTTFGFVLVLGILVDDAVVVGESIHSAHQRHGYSVNSTIIGVKQVAVPTMFGVLTTVAAFYPLSLIDGRLGKLFAQFALVCTACLVFSLIESKLILPVHLSGGRKDKQPSTNRFKRGLSYLQARADALLVYINLHWYRPSIDRALGYRYAVVTLFFAVFILVVGLVPSGKVVYSFFPDIPEETVNISFSVEQGAGFGFAHRQVAKVEEVIIELNQQWIDDGQADSEVIARSYAIVNNDVSGAVTLELSAQDSRRIDSVAVAEALNARLHKSEGLQEMSVSLEDFDDKDLESTLLSNDPEQLTQAAAMIYNEVVTIAGVIAPINNAAQGQAQIKFELTAAGRALGLTTQDLAEQIQYSYYGAEVQRLQRGKDEVRVRVIYPQEQRANITDLQNARIRTPQGEVVALSTVASFISEYVVTEVTRKNGYRSASVEANVNEAVINEDDVYRVLESRVFPKVLQQFPDMKIVEDGDAAEERTSTRSLMFIFAFSLLLIYLLVAIPLKSYWQPLVIMSAIPFGIVGAILGHWFMDTAMSILSIFGILALSGVVVNDSLLLVNQFNQLRAQGMEIHEALVEAGCLRMRAILLTSVTTVLGLVSILGETSEQGMFLIPAATSLAFGIMFATLISLVLIPVVLLMAYDIKSLMSPTTKLEKSTL